MIFVSENPMLLAAILGLALAARAATGWRWGMILDAGIIALYVRYPSLGIVALAIAQHAVRYVPTLAREVALIIKATEYQGWTVRALLFLLPGLAAFTSRPIGASQAAPAMTGATIPMEQSEVIMPLNEGLARLNNDPTTPHVGIVGPTRQGKTWFVMTLLQFRRGDLLITTPKGASYDPWGGFPAVRPEMDLDGRTVNWTKIARVIEAAHYEMLRRNTAEDVAAEQLTLVIDELTTTLAAVPSLVQKVIDLWTMGAAAGIRVIVIATDINVKGWRIEGRRDVVDNLVFAKVEEGRRWSIGRIDPNGRLINPRKLDTQQVADIASKASLHARLWPGLSASPVWAGGVGSPTPAMPHAQTPDSAGRPMATDQQLDDLIGAGYTREEAADWLQSHGLGLDSNRWRDRRAARGLGRPRAAGKRPPSARQK